MKISHGVIHMLLLTCLSGCDALPRGEALKLSGTLEMTEHAVGARVPGRLASVEVDEGDAVAPGQVLATLDRYAQAARDLQRVQGLFAEGGTTQQAVEQATLALEDQQIVSPVEGVVLVRVHDPGEVLAAGAAAVVIGDRRALWVRVFVPEGIISRVRQGQEVRVRVDGLTASFPARVTFIAPQAEFTPRNVQTPEERATQTFAVKVTLASPPPHLRPGVAADVFLDLPAAADE